MGYDYNGRLGTLWVQYEGPDVGHGIEWGLTTRTYGYTPRNRMSWFVRHHDNYNSGGVSENGNGDGYYYDAAGQLVKTLHETENLEGTDDDHGNSYVNESHYNALYELRYTLDGVGNRQQVAYRDPALPPNNDVITPYGTADSLNRYPTVGGQTASYDLRGNLIGLGSSTYAFNALNQLTGASVNGHTASFSYDPLGRCVLRTLDNVTTRLYYDGWNLIEERDAADNLLYTYIHGPGTDEMLCRVTAGTGERLYYHQDALGHVTDLTDAYGNLVEKYLYGPFGQPTVLDATGHPRANNTSSVGNRFLFCGREWLEALGLYDNRARFYSPDLGRFLQPDPAGYAASGVNLYTYCGNDPVNWSDSSGLFTDDGYHPIQPELAGSTGPNTLPPVVITGHSDSNESFGAGDTITGRNGGGRVGDGGNARSPLDSQETLPTVVIEGALPKQPTIGIVPFPIIGQIPRELTDLDRIGNEIRAIEETMEQYQPGSRQHENLFKKWNSKYREFPKAMRQDRMQKVMETIKYGARFGAAWGAAIANRFGGFLLLIPTSVLSPPSYRPGSEEYDDLFIN